MILLHVARLPGKIVSQGECMLCTSHHNRVQRTDSRCIGFLLALVGVPLCSFSAFTRCNIISRRRSGACPDRISFCSTTFSQYFCSSMRKAFSKELSQNWDLEWLPQMITFRISLTLAPGVRPPWPWLVLNPNASGRTNSA